MNMFRQGRPCKCGSSGCLGRYVSALGMVRTLREKLEAGAPSVIREWVGDDWGKITAQMVSDAYDAGDATARAVLEETGELLGFGLVNVVNLFNPQAIVVGGGCPPRGSACWARPAGWWRAMPWPSPGRGAKSSPPSWGTPARMLGAAVYGARRMGEGARM